MCPAAQRVTQALSAHDTSFEHQLSAVRKVTITNFKKQDYVQVREYYEKDGTMAPGKNGLGLSVEQWAALQAAIPDLQAHI